MFLDWTTDYALALDFSYDPLQVLVSYLFAVLGSYAGLMITDVLRSDLEVRYRRFWLVLGALGVALGVWTMHFMGMLATVFPMPVAYDGFLTGLSLVPAAFAGIVCVVMLSRKDTRLVQIVYAGIAMGTGIGAMHYIGMAAMRMSADMRYDLGRFLLSIVLAAVLALVALCMVFWARKFAHMARAVSMTASMSASMVMGLAITGMHYTGMWAVFFFPNDDHLVSGDFGIYALDETLAAAAVFAIMALIVGGTALARSLESLHRAARTSQVQLMTTVENIPGGFVLFDRDRRVVLWNEAFERLQPRLKGVLTAGIEYHRVFPSKINVHGERELDDGRWVHVEEKESTGGGFSILWSDITPQKEARSRLLSYLEGSPDAVLLLDREGRVKFSNSQTSHLIGATDEIPVVGRKMETLVSEEFCRAFEARLAEQFDAGRTADVTIVELSMLRMDGVEVPVEIALRSLGEGSELLVLCSVRDLTKRNRVEDALRESEAKYRAIVETAQEGICLIDADYRIDYSNARMVELLGYADEELTGRSVLDFVAEEWRDQVRRDYAGLGRRGLSRNDYCFLHKDGSQVWTSVTASQREDRNGNPNGAVLMIADIFEQRRLAQQSMLTKTFESSVQLTGGIAHEFNNLLLIILGNLEFIKEAKLEDPSIDSAVREAHRAGTRSAELIKQLLFFSRKQQLHPELTDIDESITKLEMLVRAENRDDVELVIKRAGALWTVDIDRAGFDRILLDLVVNAQEAMPDGGTLEVETSNAILDQDYAAKRHEVRPGEYVRVRIKDTGKGIAPEMLEKVFEPFVTSKVVGKGPGLGLSTAYGFVRQSGGDIAIRSESGRGTTVDVYLPRAKNGAGVSAATIVEPPAGSWTTRILVVEDDPGIRRAAKRILNDIGHQVIEADSGQQALAILKEREEDITLLFTDIVIPGGISGPELVAYARLRNPDVRVLFTSGYSDTRILKAGLEQDAEPFLSKPYRRDELTKAVREILEG